MLNYLDFTYSVSADRQAPISLRNPPHSAGQAGLVRAGVKAVQSGNIEVGLKPALTKRCL